MPQIFYLITSASDLVLIHVFTRQLIFLCSHDILMEIDFMVESDSYGSDHFPIIL